MTFKEWLANVYTKANGERVSEATVLKYYGGVCTISEEMLERNIIDKSLINMELYELDMAIANIFENPYFIAKDTKGNKMYSNSLKRFRCYKYFETDLIEKETIQEQIIRDDEKLTLTEKETLIKSRRGQGNFRNSLLEKYDKKCIITKISIQEVLVASHIKPWSICDNKERICKDNGLILSATYDKLFDSGLISFKANGQILISKLISKDDIKRLNLIEGKIYDIKYNENMKKFLDYHNEAIFVK